MNKRLIVLTVVFVAALAMLGCPSPNEPGVMPPQPRFVPVPLPPAPIDHGIYADPGQNTIDLDWYRDSSNTTTGYLIFRATDPTVGSDGLLTNRTQVANVTTPNQLVEPLDTAWVDTTAQTVPSVVVGQVYYYQLQAYSTSGSNVHTYSHPSAVDTFGLLQKSQLDSPNGIISATGLSFSWTDPSNSGLYQLIVQTADSKTVVWSTGYLHQIGNPVSVIYPTDGSATDLISGQSYQWRVKSMGYHQGSSSNWQNFSIR
jgi:hypothetical protein